jgi:hypothetical protein
VKSVNYKLSTSAYLKLGETNVFINFFSIHSFSLLLSLSLIPSYPARPHERGCASVPTRGRSANAGLRPPERGSTRVRAYITPVRILIFCSFSPLPLVGVVGFVWQRPFRLAKGEGVTSVLRGISLRFLQSKNSRVVFTLLMLVFSVMQVFM